MNARSLLSFVLLLPHAALAKDGCPSPDEDMPGYIFCEGQKRLERERGREERAAPRGRFLDGVREIADLAAGASVTGEIAGRPFGVDFGAAAGRGRALVVKDGAGVLTDAEGVAEGEVKGASFRFSVGRGGLDGSAGNSPLWLDFKDGRVTGRAFEREVDLSVKGRSLVGRIGREQVALSLSGVDPESCCGEAGALARKVIAVSVVAAAAAKK